jgi:hypothetical protein
LNFISCFDEQTPEVTLTSTGVEQVDLLIGLRWQVGLIGLEDNVLKFLGLVSTSQGLLLARNQPLNWLDD